MRCTASSSLQLPPCAFPLGDPSVLQHRIMLTPSWLGGWAHGKAGGETEAEGTTCTTSPRLHLNRKAGAVLRLGSEPNPRLACAAPFPSISRQCSLSPQEESVVSPRREGSTHGQERRTHAGTLPLLFKGREIPSPPPALQGSMAVASTGEKARKLKPQSPPSYFSCWCVSADHETLPLSDEQVFCSPWGKKAIAIHLIKRGRSSTLLLRIHRVFAPMCKCYLKQLEASVCINTEMQFLHSTLFVTGSKLLFG